MCIMRTAANWIWIHSSLVIIVRCTESYPITGLDKPWCFQEFDAPTYQDKRHMKVKDLSALLTGRH